MCDNELREMLCIAYNCTVWLREMVEMGKCIFVHDIIIAILNTRHFNCYAVWSTLWPTLLGGADWQERGPHCYTGLAIIWQCFVAFGPVNTDIQVG